MKILIYRHFHYKTLEQIILYLIFDDNVCKYFLNEKERESKD